VDPAESLIGEPQERDEAGIGGPRPVERDRADDRVPVDEDARFLDHQRARVGTREREGPGGDALGGQRQAAGDL
jgi:hypothetical protein